MPKTTDNRLEKIKAYMAAITSPEMRIKYEIAEKSESSDNRSIYENYLLVRATSSQEKN